VGSSAPPVPDCPWDPKASIHITKNELELTEEDKQKDEEEAMKAKEEKKKQRTYYNFTNTSVSLEASTPAEPEEGKTMD
jgi:predicted GNAT family acetyltransferase